MGMKDLGDTLAQARKLRAWTLREADEQTGISNGYLSLLEQGKVKEPSPNMLRRIADAYKIDYAELMSLAGYGDQRTDRNQSTTSSDLALVSSIHGLNPTERKEVSNYIEFIRSRHQRSRAH